MPFIDRLQLLGQMNALPSTRHGSHRSADDFTEHMKLQGSGLDAHDAALLGRAAQTIQQLTAMSSPGKSGLGSISAQFESGAAGVGAVGYDPHGGTSYGTYQIASRPGTMEAFLRFLDGAEPRWAARLRAAGPANTGSASGAMPSVWKAIAAEAPERFGELQRQFIQKTHYEPARQAIFERTGIDAAKAPVAFAEALWSTAVQHGPAGATRIFVTAIETAQRETHHPQQVIRRALEQVYALRGEDFASSPAHVQAAVRGRLQHEGQAILALLRDNLRA